MPALAIKEGQATYVTKATACRVLNVGPWVVESLITSGELKPRGYPRTRKKFNMVEILAIKAKYESTAPKAIEPTRRHDSPMS